MLLIELLTVVQVVINIGNKCCIHGNLKDCNFKTSKNPWKIQRCEISILFILKERPYILLHFGFLHFLGSYQLLSVPIKLYGNSNFNFLVT